MKFWNRKENRRLVHSDEWFADVYRKVPPPPPEGPHLNDPGEMFLRSIVFGPKPLMSDPRFQHAAQCSYCIRRVQELRTQSTQQTPKRASTGWAVATVLALGLLAGAGSYSWLHNHKTHQLGMVSQTLDLREQGTSRGGALSSTPLIRLPKSKDRLTILLPAFSEEGQYSVRLLPDRSSAYTAASAEGVAVQREKDVVLRVDLDLQRVKAGLYHLATTHGNGEASYYYPVEVSQ